MDEIVAKLEAITNDFVQIIDDVGVDQIMEFVEQRQQLLDSFEKLRNEAAFFVAEKDVANLGIEQKISERLKHIMSYDSMINDKMKIIMSDTANQLSKMNQTRKRERAYNPSYSADSIYFDKKK